TTCFVACSLVAAFVRTKLDFPLIITIPLSVHNSANLTLFATSVRNVVHKTTEHSCRLHRIVDRNAQFDVPAPLVAVQRGIEHKKLLPGFSNTSRKKRPDIIVIEGLKPSGTPVLNRSNPPSNRNKDPKLGIRYTSGRAPLRLQHEILLQNIPLSLPRPPNQQPRTSQGYLRNRFILPSATGYPSSRPPEAIGSRPRRHRPHPQTNT
ncbi:unnamed protein product, partial [Ectocarpus sp. 12 AP-2014]